MPPDCRKSTITLLGQKQRCSDLFGAKPQKWAKVNFHVIAAKGSGRFGGNVRKTVSFFGSREEVSLPTKWKKQRRRRPKKVRKFFSTLQFSTIFFCSRNFFASQFVVPPRRRLFWFSVPPPRLSRLLLLLLLPLCLKGVVPFRVLKALSKSTYNKLCGRPED